MKKTLASLLAATTIALTLTATATDVSAQWRRRGQRVVASRTSFVRTSIARTDSFANLQTCYERLWQSPSSNDNCNQRNNQNDVDDRRFQQFLFRV